ncbi:50S ribosomal protein L31 [Patescibacteria group bacterium]|nr:50S ribosomal protein L31 [Patescibacteria group bacterium]
MKKDIHPKYQPTTFTCSCGATFSTGSVLGGEFKTEICSNCHPFFTGTQKLIDSSGRVDKFMAKRKQAQAHAEKNVKKVDNTDETDETPETPEEEPAKEKAPAKEKPVKEEAPAEDLEKAA